MLQNLIDLSENWNHVLVKDEVGKNARQLVYCFVHQLLSSNNHEVHVLVYDYFSDIIQRKFAHFQNFKCHDSYKGYWNSKETDLGLHPGKNNFECLELEKDNVVIVFDSLSTVLLHQDTETFCQGLLAFKRGLENCGKKLKLISLFHEDLHVDTVCQKMEYLASTIIQFNSGNESVDKTCQITHKRKNGKVLIENEQFKMLDFRIADVKKIVPPKSSKVITQFDPAAGLSFKLSLDDKEREARSQLVLPHTRSTLSSGSGDIVYEADDNDDFDEEDPDDDLNI